MKKKLTKKLMLQKETVASLNNFEKAVIMGGLMDPTNQTGCQTECEGGCGMGDIPTTATGNATVCYSKPMPEYGGYGC